MKFNLYTYGTIESGTLSFSYLRKARRNRITRSIQMFNPTIGFWFPVTKENRAKFVRATDAE